MAEGCLILCILIQVLLITTAYGGPKQILINCPNQNWTEGKPLVLTCNIMCSTKEACNSIRNYRWINTDNFDFSCKEPKHEIGSVESHTLNCTVENVTWKQNTTIKLFVQMTTGTQERTFSVTKVSSDIPPTHPTNSVKGNSGTLSDTQTGESGRSNTVPVAVIGLLCLATVVGVLFWKYNVWILALCTRKMVSEANII